MRNTRLTILMLLFSSVLMYGCSEKKEPAQKTDAAAKSVESAVETPAEKKEAAPAAAPDVKVKAVEKKTQVTAAVKEAPKAPAPQVVDIAAGAAVFKMKCSPCHGVEGKGTTMAPALKGNDWVKGASNGEVADVILKGRQGKAKKYPNFFVDMPATKGLSEGEVNALVEYLRSNNI